MTRAELTEAVARAIYERDHKGLRNCWHWDNAGLDVEHPGSRERYLGRATAALAVVADAMRDPSERMLLRAGATPDGVSPRGGTDHLRRMLPKYWRAMLAASPIAEDKP